MVFLWSRSTDVWNFPDLDNPITPPDPEKELCEARSCHISHFSLMKKICEIII